MRKTTKDPFGHTIKFAKKHTIPLYYYNIGAPVANLHGIRTHAMPNALTQQPRATRNPCTSTPLHTCHCAGLLPWRHHNQRKDLQLTSPTPLANNSCSYHHPPTPRSLNNPSILEWFEAKWRKYRNSETCALKY